MLVMSSSATVFAGQRTPKLSDPEWPNKQWKAAIQFSRDNDSKRPKADHDTYTRCCNAASQKQTLTRRFPEQISTGCLARASTTSQMAIQPSKRTSDTFSRPSAQTLHKLAKISAILLRISLARHSAGRHQNDRTYDTRFTKFHKK